MAENFISEKGRINLPPLNPKKTRREKKVAESLESVKISRGSPGIPSEEKYSSRQEDKNPWK